MNYGGVKILEFQTKTPRPVPEGGFAAFKAWLHSGGRPKQMEGPSWNRTEVRHKLFIDPKAYRDLHGIGPQPDLTQKPQFWIPYPDAKGRAAPVPGNIVPTAWNVWDYRHKHLSPAESAVATPKDIKRAAFNNQLHLWRRVWFYRAKGNFARASRAESYCAKMPDDDVDEQPVDNEAEPERRVEPLGSKSLPQVAPTGADYRRYGEHPPTPTNGREYPRVQAVDNSKYQAYRPPAGPAPPLPPRPAPPPRAAVVDQNHRYKPYRPGVETTSSLAAKGCSSDAGRSRQQVVVAQSDEAGRARRPEVTALPGSQPNDRNGEDRYRFENRIRFK